MKHHDLTDVPTSELVSELKRRFAEMDAARRLLLGRTHADAAERPRKVMPESAKKAIAKAKAEWWAKRKAEQAKQAKGSK